MTSWTAQELKVIDQADDLKIAPYHADGVTTGTPTWIWEVVVENALYVRAYSGTSSRWYQSAIKQKAGKIHAANEIYDVAFEHVIDDLTNTKIDQAYRKKYSSSQYMTHMIGTQAKAATVRISKAQM